MSQAPAARLGPELIGQRVVVRRRLPHGRVGDVLGELLRWDATAGLLTVATRAGEVTVPLAEVVAGKTVPPAPERRAAGWRSIAWAELERVAADGWRPAEQEWLGEPGRGWQLRAAEGFTGRANSALAVGDPGLPLAQAVGVVARWYAERGLRGQLCIPEPLAQEVPLRSVADDLGWEVNNPTQVWTASWSAVALALEGAIPPEGYSIAVASEPDPGWLEVYQYRGQPLPPVAAVLLRSAPAQVFVSVRRGEQTVAVGRAASSQGWAGVTAMEVAAEHRRRGLAKVVLFELARWALAQGDRHAYLQVAEPNTGAQALYAAAGFEPHHRYHYRLEPLE
ncbi:MAG: GNAT family N-acetyltransferase [Angustibacter sp.]